MDFHFLSSSLVVTGSATLPASKKRPRVLRGRAVRTQFPLERKLRSDPVGPTGSKKKHPRPVVRGVRRPRRLTSSISACPKPRSAALLEPGHASTRLAPIVLGAPGGELYSPHPLPLELSGRRPHQLLGALLDLHPPLREVAQHPLGNPVALKQATAAGSPPHEGQTLTNL